MMRLLTARPSFAVAILVLFANLIATGSAPTGHHSKWDLTDEDFGTISMGPPRGRIAPPPLGAKKRKKQRWRPRLGGSGEELAPDRGWLRGLAGGVGQAIDDATDMLVPGKATGQEFAGLLDTGSRFAEENDRNHRDRQALIDEYTTGRGGDNIRDRFNGTRVSGSGIKGINTLINIHGGFAAGTLLGAAGVPRKGYPRDFQSKRTVQRGGKFNSEGHVRQLAREKLGKQPVNVGNNKWRSADGRWQYRGKPVDTAQNHVHLERLDPETGEVLENWHLYWPEGAGR